MRIGLNWNYPTTSDVSIIDKNLEVLLYISAYVKGFGSFYIF